MTEFKLTIDAPGIVGALNNLADALRSRPVGVQAVSSNVIPATEEKPVEAPVAPAESRLRTPILNLLPHPSRSPPLLQRSRATPLRTLRTLVPLCWTLARWQSL